ncbi:MAG: hypothetical protein J0I06_10605 [Planctomycetes bacterium]|nr:hypothetical protein [Planctomycetota bacterium]
MCSSTGPPSNGSAPSTARASPKGPRLPHLIVQEEANRAGAAGAAAADRVVAIGARFGPSGEVILTVLREEKDAALDKWLDENVKAVLKDPVLGTFEGKPAGVAWETAKGTAALKWSASAKAIQAVLANGPEKAFRRLFVSRAYCAPPADPDAVLGWDRLEFRVEGFRSGAAPLLDVPDPNQIEPKVRAQITPVWTGMTKGTPAEQYQIDCTDLLRPLNEPVAELQSAVSANRALDGVRVDPGFEFDADGKLLLAGIQPEFGAAARETLEGVVRKALAAYSGDKRHNEQTAQKYKILAAQPVSAAGMTPLPIGQVRKDLHDWAMSNKDDIRLRRLYFVLDPKSLEPQHYAVAKNGAGLVLVYQATSAADLRAVEAEFARAFARHFPQGMPAPKVAVGAPAPAGDVPPKTAEPPKDPKDPLAGKEPLLPGLTAELRRIMAADQKTWYGVLIERGYFDDQDRYTLSGVVDRKEQNAELFKLLTRLKGEEKWKQYFRDQDGAEQAVQVPKLEPIPMDEMLERVKRVTLAYPDFDGVRIESAFYDANLYLTFKAHAVGRVTPEIVGKLADLLVRDPRYTRRVVKPEQPTDPRAPRRPPQVRIMQMAGPAHADDQVANFSLGFGAKLLANAKASKEDKAKARAWLDVALLHYPNESAVWFLDAYYHFINEDESEADRRELVKRDLYRMIDLEGPLAFNGPAQRKRRYEAAKEFQGSARNDLEALWLDCFREVKDGARPITLAGK